MIAKLSKKVSSFFAEKKLIEFDDIELYKYSFEVIFSTCLNFGAVTAIAIISKNIIETMLYLAGFIPIRLIVGGFHANTHFKCFLLLMFNYSVFLLLVKIIPVLMMNTLSVILVIFVVATIILLGPIADKNKPITKEEYKSFKVKSRILVVVYAIILLVMVIRIKNPQITFCIVLGLSSVALSLLASVIHNQIKQKAVKQPI